MPEVIFNGPDGRLEGRCHHSKTPNAPIALLLHPHPQYGGTMNNRVVYQLYHAFTQRGFSALRFNFRGVGRSQGAYDEGIGELSDSASAIDWLQSANPDSPQCWIGGFSFGAWIGMQLLMRRPEITGFLSIAPPANMYDFTFLAPCPVSGLMLHGEADDVVPFDSVEALAFKLSNQRAITIDCKAIPGANHFFSDKIPELTQGIEDYLNENLVLEEFEAG